MSAHNTLDDAELPKEFWSVPEKFIKDQTLQLLHSEMSARLVKENPDADTLELMQIERITSLFFYMKDRESTGGLDSAMAYKNIMQLWVAMAANLRKDRTGERDLEQVKAQVLESVGKAISSAVKGLEPEIALTVSSALAEELERL